MGAGITGLTVAYRLSKKSEDFEVVIFETDEKIGGKPAWFSSYFKLKKESIRLKGKLFSWIMYC